MSMVDCAVQDNLEDFLSYEYRSGRGAAESTNILTQLHRAAESGANLAKSVHEFAFLATDRPEAFLFALGLCLQQKSFLRDAWHLSDAKIYVWFTLLLEALTHVKEIPRFASLKSRCLEVLHIFGEKLSTLHREVVLDTQKRLSRRSDTFRFSSGQFQQDLAYYTSHRLYTSPVTHRPKSSCCNA
ncbi:hypothetical protein OE88DRAFT_645554 [Heliocybe sulcata]|uniref:Uncharacterized protein n=1 Tax=Heliocybe sulcata TaxID=5364 RepID=A0A5C3NFG1_9AGAM|nr:hypothetical protein OE88DRAFT_645554 [Heliocybe sulcata]